MKYVLVVILIVVAFFVGKSFFQKPEVPAPAPSQKSITAPTPKPATTATEQPEAEPVQPEGENPTAEAVSETTLVTDYMSPRDFAAGADAVKYINLNQGKAVGSPEYEGIEFGIVADETDPDIVYFGTSNYQATFVAVYRYKITTKEWERLYRRSNNDGILLRVLGKWGRKLIIFRQGYDDSPSECTSPWLRGDEGGYLVTMDLDNPYGGFQPFELPDDVRAREEAKQAACYKE